ncbi:MAG: ABC transporter [Candidatus Cloacimonetes bacterium HGW-Cloacimonetes-1]|jgi:iron complex transport system ATP-binding protein|nr:MAG: ABC transporter [Candidatus Cloacimonetes bacterium HGW-Cloacimonetes-1]
MIKIADISCGYDQKEVITGLSMDLRRSDFSVIIGPNGAGKSTLLYAIMGFITLKCGSIEIEGKDLQQYARRELAKIIAYVPQETIFQFDYSVRDIVLMGRFPILQVMQSYGDEDRASVDRVLSQLGLYELRERYFSQLSGGEKQRVLIARALVQETDYIFLDETLSQLDINHQIEIMQLLREIHFERQKSILLISHNLNLAANYAENMIFIKSGAILGSGTPDEMMTEDMLMRLFEIELQTMINPQTQRRNMIYPGV